MFESKSLKCVSLSLSALLLTAGLGARATAQVGAVGPDGPFTRVASFPVFLNTSVDVETVAEIVAATPDGMTLVYTDGTTGNIGFVDIADPANPQPGGVVAVGGEPTSVAVNGAYALACVNTSINFVLTSGNLEVIDIANRQVVRTIPLGGQPDAIAVSPDGQYAAIAIENERDEDLGSGEPPQAPAGFVVIVDTVGPVANWTTRVVDLLGVCDLYPDDPEPEFVDVNSINVAAVTCQENNHVILIDLASGAVVADFPAGTVDLERVDVLENDLIQQQDSLIAVPREPDAVAWISDLALATADEGDLFGGSRGFTTWNAGGTPLFQAGNALEHLTARVGHYPEQRSENKGSEPEAVEFGRFGAECYLFIGSERASVVAVYQLPPLPVLGSRAPQLRQVLPAGAGPEGLLAIPQRDLFVVACEVDDRGAKIRSTVVIYAKTGHSSYPTILSNSRDSGVPIPWGALSGLAVEPRDPDTVYAVHDSFYNASRIFKVDRSAPPARITRELVLDDEFGVLLSGLNQLKAELPGTDDFDPAALVNSDGTVNLDLEGVARDLDGVSFWVASEGSGNLVGGVSDPNNRPFQSPNMLVRYINQPGFPPFVGPFDGITQVVFPPVELTREQLRFGFEGVALTGDVLAGETRDIWVCFQREWQNAGDPAGFVRIGRYNLFSQSWTYAYYPLDTPASPNGGWVGLSDLTHIAGPRFAVIERDDQGGPDAAIKRIYQFSVAGVQFQGNSQAPNFPVLTKKLVVDLIGADTYGPAGGLIPEKLEGLCLLPGGTLLVVNDNDGVDDNNGETQLIELKNVID